MQTHTLEVLRFSEAAVLPTRAHPTDAGLDLYAASEHVVHPGSFAVIETDVGFVLPEGTYGQIFGRSSLAVRGIFTIGGVIDQAYRGAVKAVLVNAGTEAHLVRAGDKIAQLVIIRIETPTPVEALTYEETDRGAKGFGSSGR